MKEREVNMNRTKFIYVLIAVLAILPLVPGLNAILASDPGDLGLFELDGDAVNNSTIDGDDWDTLYNGGGSAVAYTYVKDELNAKNDTIFTTGGSKDVNDISQWRWTKGTVLDKDDISSAYAAAYVINEEGPYEGHVIVYFGLDRYANNGDAMTGFWFLTNPITAHANNGTFSPAHQVGDILVLAHFTGGGTVVSIEVLEWVGPPDADNLRLLGTSENATAYVNTATADAPWDYTTKFPDTKKGDVKDFATGTFFEGGIDLTELLPGTDPCFSAFLAETRSSASYDAQLKDFVMGEFDLCSCLTVTKEINWGGVVGNHSSFNATFPVQVAGAGSFSANITFELRNGVLNATPVVVIDGQGSYDAAETTTGNNSVTVRFHGLRTGSYTVTETPPGGWDTPTFDPADATASVTMGGCSNVKVINAPMLGALKILKAINDDLVVGALANVPNTSFNITVKGPSYPDAGGTILTFNLVTGSIQGPGGSGDTYCLQNLIPGSYTVTEAGLAGWEAANITGSPATVVAGTDCSNATLVTVTNTPILGCLNITKAINWSDIIGDHAYVPDVDFTVKVTGPSYPAGSGGHDLTFHLKDGEVTYNGEAGATACLCDLIPGNYYVAETPPAGWETANITGSPATVAAGSVCGNATVVTVTNKPTPGCLEITKVVNYNVAEAEAGKINETFTVKVTGPSYPEPDGITHNFTVTNGTLYDSPWTLSNLMPGAYNITETDAGPEWIEVAPAGLVTVNAGGPCATGNVTNTYQPPDVQVAKTGNITYTIIVSNNGTSTAENVTVSDVLPGLLSWNISSSSGFTTIGIDGCGHLRGTIAFLDAGQSASVTVEAAIDGHSANPLLGNYVTVMTITPESTTDNNTDDADITQRPPCL